MQIFSGGLGSIHRICTFTIIALRDCYGDDFFPGGPSFFRDPIFSPGAPIYACALTRGRAAPSSRYLHLRIARVARIIAPSNKNKRRNSVTAQCTIGTGSHITRTVHLQRQRAKRLPRNSWQALRLITRVTTVYISLSRSYFGKIAKMARLQIGRWQNELASCIYAGFK